MRTMLAGGMFSTSLNTLKFDLFGGYFDSYLLKGLLSIDLPGIPLARLCWLKLGIHTVVLATMSV